MLPISAEYISDMPGDQYTVGLNPTTVYKPSQSTFSLYARRSGTVIAQYAGGLGFELVGSEAQQANQFTFYAGYGYGVSVPDKYYQISDIDLYVVEYSFRSFLEVSYTGNIDGIAYSFYPGFKIAYADEPGRAIVNQQTWSTRDDVNVIDHSREVFNNGKKVVYLIDYTVQLKSDYFNDKIIAFYGEFYNMSVYQQVNVESVLLYAADSSSSSPLQYYVNDVGYRIPTITRTILVNNTIQTPVYVPGQDPSDIVDEEDRVSDYNNIVGQWADTWLNQSALLPLWIRNFLDTVFNWPPIALFLSAYLPFVITRAIIGR